MSKFLSREALAAPRLKTQEIELAGGGKVLVRELYASEFDRMRAIEDELQSSVLACAYGILNADQSPMFDANNPDDLAAIPSLLSFNERNAVSSAVMSLTIGKSREELEELAKNLRASRNDSSVIGLQDTSASPAIN